MKKTVNRLLCCVWVRSSGGTGKIPFSSTPASSTFLYHLEVMPFICSEETATSTSGPPSLPSSFVWPGQWGLRLASRSSPTGTIWLVTEGLEFMAWSDGSMSLACCEDTRLGYVSRAWHGFQLLSIKNGTRRRGKSSCISRLSTLHVPFPT